MFVLNELIIFDIQTNTFLFLVITYYYFRSLDTRPYLRGDFEGQTPPKCYAIFKAVQVNDFF